jgi:anthranilate synthase component 1
MAVGQEATMTKLEPVPRDIEAHPPFGDFDKRYAAGAPQVVWTRLVADLETPVSAMLKLSDGRPLSCLLESVQGGAVRGRYSIIGLAPDVVWRSFGNRAEINCTPQTDPLAFEAESVPTLQ